MTLKCFIYIQEKYSNSKERSQLLIKNIVASFIIKGWSLVVQLLLVPVALNCLTVYEYGLWLTLSSVITWMDNFDIGLSNGLRNKLAEAIAHDDKKLAKELTSIKSENFFNKYLKDTYQNISENGRYRYCCSGRLGRVYSDNEVDNVYEAD